MILKFRTLSYVRYHWNPEPVCNKSHLFFNLFNLFWHTDKNFCFYVEVNFWDFVRNDNSNKGTTARLNEIRFVPKNKSSPIYLGPKNLNTFWCTGWAWNCQIIFRCASIHGRANFVLNIKIFTNSNQQTQTYKFTSHTAAFLSVVLITEMLQICIQTSYDQNVQLILKSYLPVVYGTPLCCFCVWLLVSRNELGWIVMCFIDWWSFNFRSWLGDRHKNVAELNRLI